MSPYLKALLQELKNFKPLFLSPDVLEQLDVKALEVSLTSENELDFNPCFFRPPPDSLVENHLSAEAEEDPQSPLHCPSIWDIIDHDPSHPFHAILEKMEGGTEFCHIPEYQQLDIDDKDDFDGEFDPDFNVTSIENEFWNIVDMIEVDNGKEMWRPRHKENDPALHGGYPWRRWIIHRYIGQPHSTMTCHSYAYMTDVNKGLTKDELMAIVSMILVRLNHKNHKSFRRSKVHPILLFTFFGGQVARMTQATFDGRDLALQYSPLWRVTGSDSMAMKLLVRYGLSKAVDGTCGPPIG
ncbi:hypothetical protein N7452_005379 [Penicillium brevicompactum]|uniref:Uncharacterized protein n=1 Tax=Penicillium brevicompactum TaxID=5074 RepID=A0A9W9QIP4_PENBR|nr:hypothetical protein N7452_005379 [Penicillium brevicompactum]